MASLTKPQTTGVTHRGVILSEVLDNLVSKKRISFESVIPNEDTKLEVKLTTTEEPEAAWAVIANLSVPALCTAWINKTKDSTLEVHVFHTAQDSINIDVDVYTLSKQPISA